MGAAVALCESLLSCCPAEVNLGCPWLEKKELPVSRLRCPAELGQVWRVILGAE